MKTPFQLTRQGFIRHADAAELARLRKQYKKDRCVLLRRFIAPDLLKRFHHELTTARFVQRRHKGIALEDCMRRSGVLNALQFLVNDEACFAAVRRFSGCGPIGCFNGRVYRIQAGKGHYDSWHSDIDKKNRRLIGMSVNLSPRRYRGGVLQIRDSRSKKSVYEIANIGPGDAILFRLSPRLEHQVTPVHGRAPKIAYAGWFQAKPRLLPKFRRAVRLRASASKRKPAKLPGSLAPKALGRKEGDGQLLLDPRRPVYFYLDPVGSRVWRWLAQGRQGGEILKEMERHYAAEPERLRSDLAAFLGALKSKGLIEAGAARP